MQQNQEYEARNPKQIQMTKTQNSKQTVRRFEDLIF